MDHDIAAVAKPAQYINPHRTDRAIESKDDLAVVSEPISDASDHGVSLQELSQPELEAVLQDLQSNE